MTCASVRLHCGDGLELPRALRASHVLAGLVVVGLGRRGGDLSWIRDRDRGAVGTTLCQGEPHANPARHSTRNTRGGRAVRGCGSSRRRCGSRRHSPGSLGCDGSWLSPGTRRSTCRPARARPAGHDGTLLLLVLLLRQDALVEEGLGHKQVVEHLLDAGHRSAQLEALAHAAQAA